MHGSEKLSKNAILKNMTTKQQAWEAELASMPTLNEMMNKLAIRGYKRPNKGQKEAKRPILFD